VVHFNFFAITIRSEGKRAIYSTIRIVSIFFSEIGDKFFKISDDKVREETSLATRGFSPYVVVYEKIESGMLKN
jgi:hypothetical protein